MKEYDIERSCVYHSIFFSVFYITFVIMSLLSLKKEVSSSLREALNNINMLLVLMIGGIIIFTTFIFFIFGIFYGKIIKDYKFKSKQMYLSLIVLSPVTAKLFSPLVNPYYNLGFSIIFWLFFISIFIHRNKEYFSQLDNKKEETPSLG